MSTTISSQLLFALQPFNSDLIYQSLIIVVLLVASGLIAAAEIAFFSLTPTEVRRLEESESKSGKRVAKIVNEPKKLLATVLLGANLINIAIVILFAALIDTMFVATEGQKFLIDAIAVTFLLLLVCEVIPKVYANQNAIKVANFMAVPFQFLETSLKPLAWILLSSTTLIDKRFRRRSKNITVDELGHALELTFKNQKSDEEKRILEGIVKFGNTSASQIMRSRMDVIAIDNTISFQELVPTILGSGYSRIPVYVDSLDKIIGILVAKDLLPHIDGPIDFDWKTLIREPFYVPGGKKIDDLLSDFRHERTHMAVVVDEYGGTLGIITLEDVLEEIVGDITDEFDDEDITYTKIDDSNYVFEGKTHLTDIYKILKIDGAEFEKHRGEAETLAGFLLEISKRFLNKNEKIKFGNYLFVVEAADKKRIKQIKITINPVSIGQEFSIKGKKINVLIPLIFAIGLISCGEEATTPRPPGFFRLNLPEQVYDSANTSSYTFQKSIHAIFSKKSEAENEKGYMVLAYPKLKATFYFSFFDPDTNLSKLIDDCHALAYNHTGKADDIVPVKVDYPTNDVHGLIYEFKGNAATPIQFYVTDSVNNFLRGSLYFYAKPNYDSIKPVLQYVRKDLDKALSSLKWKIID